MKKTFELCTTLTTNTRICGASFTGFVEMLVEMWSCGLKLLKLLKMRNSV